MTAAPPKYLFEEARKLYPKKSGKRGFDKEWKDFTKITEYKGKYDEIMPLLKPAILRQIAYREDCARKSEWCRPWKDFCRWMKGGWWTEDTPQVNGPKKKKCGLCGKPSTRSKIVYFGDGAKTVFRCDDDEFPVDVEIGKDRRQA